MCGICGEIRFTSQSSTADWPAIVALMARRGPDDEGFWSEDHYCTLGFRRLAILDLSPAGHQPMITAEGRYVLVYNGEMYNYQVLKQELEQHGVRFHSTGDTEVVLQALAYWGRAALARFNGMFALAIYDTAEKQLLLARDHVGIKPLYYMLSADGVMFASQYNQILAHPWSRGLTVVPDSLALYLQRYVIPAPHALLERTFMLEPGTWLEVRSDNTIKQGRYFEFPVYVEPTLRGEEADQAVDAAITAAVRRQLISDVPIGTFLSGGIDSPLVTAKAVEATGGNIRSYSIGLGNHADDELADAAAYANELGVRHILEPFTAEKALDMFGDAIAATGEPFAEYSILPTMLVAQLARQDVTVILSGDGGDELFWGYARTLQVLRRLAMFRVPLAARLGGGALALALGRRYLTQGLISPTVGEWYRSMHRNLAPRRFRRLFPDLPIETPDSQHFRYTSSDPDETAQWLRKTELERYLPKVLLKVDRGSMYHSLEVRVPLLDREVLDVASRVDWRSNVDLDRRVGKLTLRRSLKRHVSHQTLQKRGFTVPIDEWLRGPLRPIMEDLVLKRTDLLGHEVNRSVMAEMYHQHCSEQTDFRNTLWAILCLVLWEQKYVSFQANALLRSPV